MQYALLEIHLILAQCHQLRDLESMAVGHPEHPHRIHLRGMVKSRLGMPLLPPYSGVSCPSNEGGGSR